MPFSVVDPIKKIKKRPVSFRDNAHIIIGTGSGLGLGLGLGSVVLLPAFFSK